MHFRLSIMFQLFPISSFFFPIPKAPPSNRIFRDLVCSQLVRSLPPIGPFATLYFSHLIDPSRFATTMFFAASRPIMTVNYSLTTEPHSFPPIMTVNFSLTTKLHSRPFQIFNKIEAKSLRASSQIAGLGPSIVPNAENN